jgi:aldehyde dehydrogenase (NAD+)
MQKFRALLDRQKTHYNTAATKTYEWRIEQLERMERMLKENAVSFEETVSRDFKTASQEKVFEVSAPLGTIEFTKFQLREWMKPTRRPSLSEAWERWAWGTITASVASTC